MIIEIGQVAGRCTDHPVFNFAVAVVGDRANHRLNQGFVGCESFETSSNAPRTGLSLLVWLIRLDKLSFMSDQGS